MLDMNQKHRQWLATEVSESIKHVSDTEHLPWAAGAWKHVYFALTQYQPLYIGIVDMLANLNSPWHLQVCEYM